MANKDPYGMAIRLPEDLVKSLRKVKKQQGLPSLASAIKYWVEQQAEERREVELDNLKKEVAKVHKLLKETTDRYDLILTLNCKAVHHILHGDHPICKDLRKAMRHEKDNECPLSDYTGARG